jgi:hypothetical protein
LAKNSIRFFFSPDKKIPPFSFFTILCISKMKENRRETAVIEKNQGGHEARRFTR